MSDVEMAAEDFDAAAQAASSRADKGKSRDNGDEPLGKAAHE